MKIILLIFVTAFSAYSSDCDKYLEVGDNLGCDSKDSYFHYAYSRCELIKERASKVSLSNALMSFIPDVRSCLIDSLIISPYSCQDSHDQGILDHSLCFKRYNYCDLSVSDKYQLFRIMPPEPSHFQDYFKTGLRVLLDCF